MPRSISQLEAEGTYSLRSLGDSVRVDLGLTLRKLRQLRILIQGLELNTQGLSPHEIGEELGSSPSGLDRAARTLLGMTLREARGAGVPAVASRILARVRMHQRGVGHPRHRKAQNPTD